MTVLYVDASAWVKRYFQEAGSAWINQQFDAGILMGASTLGLVEVMATCARKRAAGAVDASRFEQIESDLLDDWKGLFQIELTSAIVERSLDAAKDACAARRGLRASRIGYLFQGAARA